MTPWTGSAELRERARREWERGLLPCALVGGPAVFPLRIRLKAPSSSELAERFDEARAWIADLSAGEGRGGYRLEWRELNHRQLGQNRIPEAAVFDSAQDLIALAGKRREGERLVALARAIAAAFPALEPWLARRAPVVLEKAEDWPAILATLVWFRAHPRSGLYARQIDAPGVHSKFVEGNRALLGELLDLVLPGEAIDAQCEGSRNFARRYGLRDKPLYVRFRVLDPALEPTLGLAQGQSQRVDEMTIPAEAFAQLLTRGDCVALGTVFITENEINFLAFPDQPRSLIVFGAGYGFAALARADWLHACRIRYWGDLDTHGFAILDQLRADFPQAESLMMDRDTLLAHRDQWTTEGSPSRAQLTRLSSDEGELYEDLRADTLAPSLRLEQERIGFAWVRERV